MDKYLKSANVEPLKVVLIKHKNRFEGWAQLISTDDPGMTYYEEDGTLMVKQRWLVEWLDVRSVRDFLGPADRLTQISLAGHRTHRHICFLADRFEDHYSVPTQFNKERSEINMNDDFSGVF